jgi:hypothetical protein
VSGGPVVSGPSKVDLQVERPVAVKERAAERSEVSPEAALWAGLDMDRSLEVSQKDVEARVAEASAAEAADKEEGAEHLEDTREANERKERLKRLGRFRSVSLTGHAKPDPRAALMRRPATTGKDGFGQQTVKQAALSSTSYGSLTPVGRVQNALAGAVARPEKPPDAFKLLREAKDKGVLFSEDALADGHSEDQDDPALAEAVEECIRQCFGLRGILRIGPGKNDLREPIIVVAITQGFTDAGLARVPAVVNGFSTLIAIPFDLLPLKRER